MCLFLLYSFTKCIASCDDVVVVGNNVEYRVLTVILPVVKVLR